jgi:proline iminopeptidase
VPGSLVPIGETRLYVEQRGQGYPLVVLHGGPGLDHRMFGDYLDPLGDSYRLILVDQRSQGRSDSAPPSTWSLAQMAADVSALAAALQLGRYAVLGHSFGSFVALQHAVDEPGAAAQTIISGGVPSARFLEHVEHNLAIFEPPELRRQVADSWAREKSVETADQVAALLHDQQPFHFADPRDRRIAAYEARSAGAVYAPDVLRFFANLEYGAIDVEGRLSGVRQPTLILVGRHERVCSVPAAECMAAGIPRAELVVFEHSAHMTFVEENERYLGAVRSFLDRRTADGSSPA